MSTSPTTRRRAGFTLVEASVASALTGLFMLLGLGAVSEGVEATGVQLTRDQLRADAASVVKGIEQRLRSTEAGVARTIAGASEGEPADTLAFFLNQGWDAGATPPGIRWSAEELLYRREGAALVLYVNRSDYAVLDGADTRIVVLGRDVKGFSVSPAPLGAGELTIEVVLERVVAARRGARQTVEVSLSTTVFLRDTSP